MFDFNELKEKFSLTQVSEKELWDLRITNVPLIIVKNESELWITKETGIFPDMLKCLKSREHKCNVCKKFSGLSNAEGGCDKTHDIFLPFPYNRNLRIPEDEFDPYMGIISVADKLKVSCRIEKYPQILFGIEYLTNRAQRCLILECSRFRRYDSPK